MIINPNLLLNEISNNLNNFINTLSYKDIEFYQFRDYLKQEFQRKIALSNK